MRLGWSADRHICNPAAAGVRAVHRGLGGIVHRARYIKAIISYYNISYLFDSVFLILKLPFGAKKWTSYDGLFGVCRCLFQGLGFWKLRI